MGDSGEGLVDAGSRIQERMEELQADREIQRRRTMRDPQLERALESLRLARIEFERQLSVTIHAGRRTQLQQALEEVDRRMARITLQQSVAELQE